MNGIEIKSLSYLVMKEIFLKNIKDIKIIIQTPYINSLNFHSSLINSRNFYNFLTIFPYFFVGGSNCFGYYWNE